MRGSLAYGGMHFDQDTDRAEWIGVGTRLVVLLVAFAIACGTFAMGCGIFGPRPEPPPAPAPTPTTTPESPPLAAPRRAASLRGGERRQAAAGGLSRWPSASRSGRRPPDSFQINELVENPDFLAFDFNDPKKPDRGRVPPGPNNPLGLRWMGFATAHGWQVGFHGTAKTSVLGQAVSHGCVRMSNTDVVEVFKRVKLGTTVVVEP